MNIHKILKSNLFENFLSLGTIQGLNYILPLITIPFLFNQLGVEKYGLTNFSFAFIQYFVVLTDFGFGLSGTRYIAVNRDDKNEINRFLCSATIARLFFASLSFLIYLLAIFFIPSFSKFKLYTLLFFGVVIGNVFNPTWFFQGIERMKYNTLLYTITRTVSILPLFIFVRGEEDFYFIPICYSAGSIISGFFSLLLIKYMFKMSFFWTSFKEIRIVTIDSSRYFFSRVSNSLYTNTNSFILGLVCGNVAVGYYSLAEKIYLALSSVYAPINGALFPYMTKEKNQSLIKKVIKWGTLINTSLVVVFYFIFPYICPLFFDDFSSQSMMVLSILLVSSIVGMPSTFLGYPFLAAFGHPNYTNNSLIITSLFHVFGLLIFYILGWVNIRNVAVMVLLSDSLLLLIRVIGVKKYKLWQPVKLTK